MKMIMFAAPSSNTGKTTLTLGTARALKNRNLDVSTFKVGPDFIDAKYLSLAAKKQGGNLDLHMLGADGIKKSLYLNKGEIGLVEGVMGYFDGIYNTYENSSYDIARHLDIPTILVYNPVGEMFSAIPKIKGMVDFSKGRIKALILNKTDPAIYKLLKPQIEKHIGIEVLGYLPKDENMSIGSRYLGLFQAHEVKNLDEKLDYIAEKIEETINIDRLIELTRQVNVGEALLARRSPLKIGIAYDEAFNFYYGDNIKLFERIFEIHYFSPMRDEKLPEVDLVYLGGGYPELYLEELAKNTSMIESIREISLKGKYIYGEGGGLMYLMETIEAKAMCNIFTGNSYMTPRLQRFGYVDIELREDCILGKKGDKLKGQEFHKSLVDIDEKPYFNIKKPKRDISWTCGYQKGNTFASYSHLNFLGNMEAMENLLNQIMEGKR